VWLWESVDNSDLTVEFLHSAYQEFLDSYRWSFFVDTFCRMSICYADKLLDHVLISILFNALLQLCQPDYWQ
jgi:hypothetical protein